MEGREGVGGMLGKASVDYLSTSCRVGPATSCEGIDGIVYVLNYWILFVGFCLACRSIGSRPEFRCSHIYYYFLKSKQTYDGCEDVLQRVELLW
jgi:hypothetical protein